MTLSKAFDPQALISALEAKGLADAKRIVTTDILPVVFDWLNSSAALEFIGNPLFLVAAPYLPVLEQKAIDALSAHWGATGA